MKASDLFVRCLENEGVERIFGLPGEENADLMMSLEDSPIEFVLCRHEQAAAFMADVYGRLTGKPGVCLGTLGPGATNLVTGVADGNMDRAPMIVITGQADTQRLHKESHQAMDVVGMFKPITKWAHTIIHPDNIPEVIRKAFKIAQMEKPGACLIELPENIAEADTDRFPIPVTKTRRPAPDEKAIRLAMDLITQAKLPIILAGNGAIRKRASKQLVEFAHRTGIPVVNTFMGKGAIPWSDEHCLFTVGLQAKDVVLCEIDRSDLVITVGFDIVEYHPHLWNSDPNTKILHIDFIPGEIDENYKLAAEVIGDIANSLWQLNEALDELPRKPLFDIKERQGTRNAMLDEFRMHAEDDARDVIKPQKVLWDVREFMGPSDIVLSDVGAHKMWIARHYQCEEPNTCLISNGFCSMGFAFPGAMAAKIAHPESKVLAICGDAGVLMNIQDLETAVRLKLDFVTMIWEDHEYGLIKWKQQGHFNGRHTDLAFNNPDWIQLAESFGAKGIRVNESAGLKGALEEAFSTKGPVLLVLPIDYDENVKLTKRLGEISSTL